MTDLRDDVAVFAELLRAAGMDVGTDRAVTFAVAAAPYWAAGRDDDLYWAGRVTLVADPAQVPTYDQVFDAWFGDAPSTGSVGAVSSPARGSPAQVPPTDRSGSADPADTTALQPTAGAPASSRAAEGSATPGGPEAGRLEDAADGEPVDAEQPDEVAGAIASLVEALRRRRFDVATQDELEAIQELMGTIVVTVPQRRSRRMRPARRGSVMDLRRSVRSAIQTDGELLRRPRRRRRTRPRRLVLVLDVSGSMAGYSRALLHFAHAARLDADDVEVFCFGTRLTRLTDDLASRDVDVALAAAAARVVDWDGGTLIGQSLATLTRTYGPTGLLRGAVVVVCSDGLERGDPAQVDEEMARIARYAHRVVWVNPLKADERYEPLARGMAAALPHVDRFVTGHDLASLDELAAALRHL